jgi:hypothetical protein
VVKAGTSKGSKINQYGCSTFGTLAAEAQQEEEEEETVGLHWIGSTLGLYILEISLFYIFSSPT